MHSRSNWNSEVLVLRRGENWSTRRKTSGRHVWEPTTNSNHIEPVDAGIWTRVTLVGGECSHHCTNLAPLNNSSFTTTTHELLISTSCCNPVTSQILCPDSERSSNGYNVKISRILWINSSLPLAIHTELLKLTWVRRLVWKHIPVTREFGFYLLD